MGFADIYKRLFQNDGKGPLLREEIIPETGGSSGEYVTLDTEQTISGAKTFTTEPYVTHETGNTMFYTQCTGSSLGTVRIGFGIGSGMANRGIYDSVQGKWLIDYNAAGELCLDGGGATTGLIVMSAKSSVPSGWLLCNGANVSRTTYANLYSAIGTTYGSGDGSTTFTLPDFRNRFPEGVNTYSLGTSVSAGVPNVTGTVYLRLEALCGGYSGALDLGEAPEDTYERLSVEGSGYDLRNLRFRASRYDSLYGNASTVQPQAVAVYFLIKT